MSKAEEFPDVGPDDPSLPENEGPMREFPRVVPPLGIDALWSCKKCGKKVTVAAGCSCTTPGMVASVVYGPSVSLKVPRNLDIRERDILWCESLLRALGEGVIDTYQMEKILRIFNEHRPDN